jgi:hypothetical protein
MIGPQPIGRRPVGAKTGTAIVAAAPRALRSARTARERDDAAQQLGDNAAGLNDQERSNLGASNRKRKRKQPQPKWEIDDHLRRKPSVTSAP